jgi:hypothetical protein
VAGRDLLYCCYTLTIQAHRALQMFQHTGRLEAIGAFSEANIVGNKYKPSIWHTHARSVNANFMPLHRQHRFNALIDKTYIFVEDMEGIEDGNAQNTYTNNGAFYIDVPSSP